MEAIVTTAVMECKQQKQQHSQCRLITQFQLWATFSYKCQFQLSINWSICNQSSLPWVKHYWLIGEVTHHANFGFNWYSGGFSPNRRNITTLWLFLTVLSCPYLFFLVTVRLRNVKITPAVNRMMRQHTTERRNSSAMSRFRGRATALASIPMMTGIHEISTNANSPGYWRTYTHDNIW